MKYYLRLLLISLLVIPAGIPENTLHAQAANRLQIAKILEKAGQYKDALQIYLPIYHSGDRSVQVISGIENAYRELSRHDELIEFLTGLTRDYPENISYQISLGTAWFLNNQKDKALQTWRVVYDSEPQNIMNYRLIASAMIQLRLYDQAIEVYKQAMQRMKNQEILYREIGNLYRAQLNYERAVDNFLRYYRYDTKQFNYINIQILTMSKDDDAVGRIIGAITDHTNQFGSDPSIDELLAGMYIKKKEFGSAFRIYRQLDQQDKNRNYLILFGKEAEKNLAFEYAIQAYNLLLSESGDNRNKDQVQLSLAKCYYEFGEDLGRGGDQLKAGRRVEESVRMLESIQKQAARQDVKRDALELQGDIYLEFYNDTDRAIDLYSLLLKENLQVHIAGRVKIKLGQSFLIKNDLNKASKIFRSVNNGQYVNQALYYLAEISFYNGQFSGARSEFEQLISRAGMSDTLANNALERIFFIDQYSADSSGFAEFSAAELLLAQEKRSEAAKKYNELFFEKKQISPVAGLKAASIYNSLNMLDEGIVVLERFISAYADDPEIDQAFFALAGIYARRTDFVKAVACYQQILQNYPGSFYLDEARRNLRELTSNLESLKKQ
ncbi:MAG: tetratricopeptide repeat protein [Calditrichaceae bacterium]